MVFGRSYSRIAIDAGPVSVALCQLRRFAGSLSVYRHALLEDPLRSDDHPSFAERPPTVRARRLIEQGEFHGIEAAIALKPPDVSFFPARVPETLADAPRSQWLTMLRFEAARQAQCAPDSLEVDFWPLPPGNRMGDNVLIVSVARAAVDRWVEFCAAAGLQLARVDVAPCAFLRLVVRQANFEPQSTLSTMWGILDMGSAHCTLTIGLGNAAVYVRALTTTGDSYTQAVQHALGLDRVTAEMLKRRYSPRTVSVGPDGVVTASRPHRWVDDVEELSQVLEPVLRTRTRALAGEVERAFGYVLEGYPNATPGTLYLAGGGARLAGLDDALREALELKTVRLDPAVCLNVRDPRSAAGLGSVATCVGLALGDFE